MTRAVAAILLSTLFVGCAVPDAPIVAPVGARTSIVDPVAYQWVPLGDLGGEASSPNDINDQNQIVGRAYYTASEESGPYHAFLWENGVMFDLGTLGGRSSVAEDINEAGVIVGTSDQAVGPKLAVRWTNRVIEALESGGVAAAARKINERGDILGSIGGIPTLWVGGVPQSLPISGVDLNNSGVVVGNANVDSTQHAMLWRDGVVTDLGTFGGVQSSAYDITESGIVTGSYRLATGESRGFRWRDGVAETLDPLPGDVLTYGGVANNSGQVIGNSYGSIEHGVIWSGTSALDLGHVGSPPTWPKHINDHGVVVGTGHISPGPTGWTRARAFAWQNGVIRNLGTGLGSFSWGHKVNNNGLVIGETEVRPTSIYRTAAVWIPIVAVP